MENDFFNLLNEVLAEGLEKIDALTDEELREITLRGIDQAEAARTEIGCGHCTSDCNDEYCVKR